MKNSFSDYYSMSNNLQSAYKKFHSTESALLKVENDVLLNMEKGRVTALTLLDLSAGLAQLTTSL